jgi:hypothetical protein
MGPFMKIYGGTRSNRRVRGLEGLIQRENESEAMLLTPIP